MKDFFLAIVRELNIYVRPPNIQKEIMTHLSSKELSIMECLSKKPSASQREIAKTTGVSLGLINVILKRFAQLGYIKVGYLNKKKLEYLPTSAGTLETAQKKQQTTTWMIQGYKKIQAQLANLFQELYDTGYNYFSIYGDGELKEIVESIFRASLEEAPVTLGKEHRANPQAVVLNLTAEPMAQAHNGDVVNVLEKIGPFL